MHRGIQNWNCYSAGEAGMNKWAEFCDWATGQPIMAPRGQLAYDQNKIRFSIRTICDNMAKIARTSR